MTIDSSIHEAAQLLKKGQVVAFPTETVYGYIKPKEDHRTIH